MAKGPTAVAMGVREGKTERFDIAHGFGDDLLVVARQVEAAGNGIDRGSSGSWTARAIER